MFESRRHGVLGSPCVVARLGLRRRDISDRLEKPVVVEPVHPFERREFHRLDAAPRPSPVDHLGLEQAVDGLGQRVDAPMSVKQFLTPAAAACKDG